MKQKIVKIVRKAAPEKVTHRLEESYRKFRVKALSMKYGNPAKHLRVIAVTGTNGKTTTVNFLNEILKQAGKKTAMFSTAVIEIDGERKLNDMNVTVASVDYMQQFFSKAKRSNVDFVIMEFPSHAIHQHKLDNVPVEMAIMTNLTQDHLDYHKTMENYAEVKSRIFAMEPKYIVLNRDDEWFKYFDKFPASSQKITYGKNKKSEALIENIKLYRKGTEAHVKIDHQTELYLEKNLPGEFNAYNMTAAVAGAYILGIDLKDIVEGVANLESIPGRFERATDKTPFDIIVDYAHTPDGLEKLLESAKKITKNRVILVFGATGDRDKTKRPIMGKIAANYADRIFLTDEESYNENPATIRSMIMSGIEKVRGGSAKTNEVADRREAIEKAISIAKKGDTILITGMGHEIFRIINGKRVPWNDSEVVRQIVGDKSK